jgi:hypothetical protein
MFICKPPEKTSNWRLIYGDDLTPKLQSWRLQKTLVRLLIIKKIFKN